MGMTVGQIDAAIKAGELPVVESAGKFNIYQKPSGLYALGTKKDGYLQGSASLMTLRLALAGLAKKNNIEYTLPAEALEEARTHQHDL